MRAWQVTDTFSIEGLRLNPLSEPSPGPGQVVVAVKAVSLNYRDLLVVKGLYSKKLRLPLTICSDAVGEVIATGPSVGRVAPGDRVATCFMPGWLAGPVTETGARSASGAFAPGVLAERLLFPEDALVKLPAYLSWEEASCLPCAAVTAWNALVVLGQLKQGDTVLILGTGGVSLFALQLALASGARVIATTSSDAKAACLTGLGAHAVVNYSTTPDWDEAVRKLTGGVGVDHVVEIGGSATIGRSIRATRLGGTISLIGNRATGAADVNLTTALMKAIRIQGVFVGSREMFESMNRSLELHRIQPVIDTVFDFEGAADALRHLDSGAHFGKVCIRS
jgi:NADPH:quinone reductase-like Zn-dependent oxidoreductase